METFQVETIYHAAAYKYVPLVEHNVVGGVRNNIFGTLYTARVAIAENVSNFVLISTAFVPKYGICDLIWNVS